MFANTFWFALVLGLVQTWHLVRNSVLAMVPKHIQGLLKEVIWWNTQCADFVPPKIEYQSCVLPLRTAEAAPKWRVPGREFACDCPFLFIRDIPQKSPQCNFSETWTHESPYFVVYPFTICKLHWWFRPGFLLVGMLNVFGILQSVASPNAQTVSFWLQFTLQLILDFHSFLKREG